MTQKAIPAVAFLGYGESGQAFVAGFRSERDISVQCYDIKLDAGDAAAQEASKRDLNGAFFFDCNSCAPQTKTQTQAVVEAAGGRYVESYNAAAGPDRGVGA